MTSESRYPVVTELEALTARVLHHDHHRAPVDALDAVTAADRLSIVAAGIARLRILDARAAGRTWEQIAAALKLTGVDADGAAFTRVATRVGRGDWICTWRCTTCERPVIDHGPYGGHPSDLETGHTDDCARHLADIDTYTSDF